MERAAASTRARADTRPPASSDSNLRDGERERCRVAKVSSRSRPPAHNRVSTLLVAQASLLIQYNKVEYWWNSTLDNGTLAPLGYLSLWLPGGTRCVSVRTNNAGFIKRSTKYWHYYKIRNPFSPLRETDQSWRLSPVSEMYPLPILPAQGEHIVGSLWGTLRTHSLFMTKEEPGHFYLNYWQCSITTNVGFLNQTWKILDAVLYPNDFPTKLGTDISLQSNTSLGNLLS